MNKLLVLLFLGAVLCAQEKAPDKIPSRSWENFFKERMISIAGMPEKDPYVRLKTALAATDTPQVLRELYLINKNLAPAQKKEIIEEAAKAVASRKSEISYRRSRGDQCQLLKASLFGYATYRMGKNIFHSTQRLMGLEALRVEPDPLDVFRLMLNVFGVGYVGIPFTLYFGIPALKLAEAKKRVDLATWIDNEINREFA